MSGFLVTYGRSIITAAVGLTLVIVGAVIGNPAVLDFGLVTLGVGAGIQVNNSHGQGIVAK